MKRWWLGWRRRGDALTPGVDPGVSFSWPRDTNLTRVFRGARRNAPEIAMRESAASPSQPEAGRPVETTAHDAPPPQRDAADWRPELVEALAERAHIAWSGWTRWMIDQWSPAAVARWERQIATPYADLSETEKESDRIEARIYLDVINQALESLPRPQEIVVPLPTGAQITFTARAGATSYDVYHDGYITTVTMDGVVLGSRRAQPAEVVTVSESVANTTDWIERARPGSTPVLGGIVGTQDADGSTVVWSDGPAVYGHGETAGAAMRDYAECAVDVRDIQARYGDALDSKAAIRAQQAHAERGDAGDGHPSEPPDYDVWSR